MPILLRMKTPVFLSMYLDNATESRLDNAVTTFLSIETKSRSFDDCPKVSVAKKSVAIVIKEYFNVIGANEQGLALLGYLKNVSQQLKPNTVLKVEVIN